MRTCSLISTTSDRQSILMLPRLPLQRLSSEVEGGIASVNAALGDPKALSPFSEFRV